MAKAVVPTKLVATAAAAASSWCPSLRGPGRRRRCRMPRRRPRRGWFPGEAKPEERPFFRFGRCVIAGNLVVWTASAVCANLRTLNLLPSPGREKAGRGCKKKKKGGGNETKGKRGGVAKRESRSSRVCCWVTETRSYANERRGTFLGESTCRSRVFARTGTNGAQLSTACASVRTAADTTNIGAVSCLQLSSGVRESMPYDRNWGKSCSSGCPTFFVQRTKCGEHRMYCLPSCTGGGGVKNTIR